MTALHVWINVVGGVVLLSGTSHMPLGPLRYQTMIMLLCLLRMTRRVSVNVAVHPWSQSWPIDRRPVVCICGKRCWRRAAGGSVGMFKVRVWVDTMVPPLGNKTVIGRVVFVPFLQLPS